MRGLLAFIAWSLIEISLFVTVGGWIGLWGTLMIVLGSGLAGVAILRWQGAHLGQTLKSNVVAMRDPLSPMAHSGLIVMAAVLLILPGFLTDVLGAVLLLSPVRHWIVQHFGTKLRAAVFDRAAAMMHPPQDEVVEAAAVEVQREGPHEPSGWTRP